MGITGLPEVAPGSDLIGLILEGVSHQDLRLLDRDILVITQKVVSKSEGRLVRLSEVKPSSLAKTFAEDGNRDPRSVEVVLGEARRIVKMDRGILITETAQGMVCAHAGVDASNVPDLNEVALLPTDPDRSAATLRSSIRERVGADVAIIISDTFGRPWREGLVNVADRTRRHITPGGLSRRERPSRPSPSRHGDRRSRRAGIRGGAGHGEAGSSPRGVDSRLFV